MKLRAVLLNCTLKKSPAISNTEALMRRVMEWYDRLDVESELIRVVDLDVSFGVSSDEGDGDQWPLILERIKVADILVVGMPIWFGVRSSVARLVIERLDGTYSERNAAGQYPLYNKVGGVVVTGNEDGAHDAAGTTLFNLSHLGCTIPPNADTYWVGPRSFVHRGGRREPSLHAAHHPVDGAQHRPPGAHPPGLADPRRGQHLHGGDGAPARGLTAMARRRPRPPHGHDA